jgi:hypothetical protein
MVWGVSDRFVTARTSMQIGQTGAINALVRAMKSHWNLSQRTHLIHAIGLKLKFWGVSDFTSLCNEVVS